MDVEKGPGPSRSDGEFLASSGSSLYNVDKRPRRDIGATSAYCLLSALVVFWGIPAFTHTDPNAGLYSPAFYNASTSCDVVKFQAANPPAGGAELDPTFMHAFKVAISVWLPITAVISIVSAAVYLLLFRRFAKAMVRLTIIWSVGSGVLFAVVCFAVGAIPFGIILLVMSAITALFYWWIRDQLKMCAELLAMAGRGLNENLGLVPAAIGIKVVGMAVLIYGAAGFFSAVNIGDVYQSPYAVTRNSTADEAAVCADATGLVVPCCEFRTAGWAGVYAFFAACFIMWTAMLIMQIKLYTVADTTAQWYFSAAGSSSASIGSARQTSGSVRLALRHCLTSSFGSVAFAAAVLAVLRAVRRAMEDAARRNVICCIINCIIQPLLALAEQFTRFATIAAAITGEAFVPAAKSVFGTLKRNLLQTYSLWWVPDAVLQFAVLLMALTWSGIVFFATYAANKKLENVWGVAFAVAAVSFMCMFYVLLFVAGLLLDVVNTLYICYAMDKDQRRVTHPEIHALYNQVPSLQGSVVQNPDGAILYGAPDPHQAPPPPPYPGYAPANSTYYHPDPYSNPYPPPGPVVQPPPPPAAGYTAVHTADRV